MADGYGYGRYGIFHADDVFGVALMQSIYNDLEIIRTRDEELLKTCDIVSDVGNGKYDHHHVDKIRRENGIPYCGFGLLWRDFGISYINAKFPDLSNLKRATRGSRESRYYTYSTNRCTR